MTPTTDEIRLRYARPTLGSYSDECWRWHELQCIAMLCDEVDRLNSLVGAAEGTVVLLEDQLAAKDREIERLRKSWADVIHRQSNKIARLREVLKRLDDAADVFRADQSRATDQRVGRVPPVTVSDCEVLNAASRYAREVLNDG